MQRIWVSLLEKRPLTYLIMTALIVYGLFSIFSMRRESTPEVQIPIAIVNTVLPGAAPADVEQLVTNEVENAVGNVENIKTLTSASKTGVSTVVVEFEASADLDKSIQKVRDEVDKVKSKLPTDALTPVVMDVNFADQPVIIASVSSDLPVTAFKDSIDEVKDQLEQLPGVSKADESGVRGRAVTVIVHKDALWLHNISLADVVAGIAANNLSLPVGSIEQNSVEYTVSLKSDIQDPAQVASLPIIARDGTTYALRDIAFVSDGVEDPSTISRTSHNGAPALQAATLSIHKQRGADITKVTGEVKAALKAVNDDTTHGITTTITYDAGEQIFKDLNELTRTGLLAVLFVMAALFATLGWREALVAGLSIPLSFVISFIALRGTGNTLNIVSLFSLILSIGILVDSAIVVTEAIHVNMGNGMTKVDAARKAIHEYSKPLTAGTLTTIAVFLPLFTISGVTGQFIKSIPFTVVFVLIASIFVALGLTPLIATLMLKSTHKSDFEKRQERYAEELRVWYKKKIVLLLDYKRRKQFFVGGIVLLFFVSLALPIVGLVKATFFPQGDVEYLYIDIEEPQGTPLAQTDLAARAVEETLYNNPNIETFTTTVGGGSSFDQDPVFGSRYASINITLSPDRKQTSTEVLANLQEKLKQFKTFTARIYEPNNGPSTGAPIKITFYGDNAGDLKLIAPQAKALLTTIPGTRDVISSSEADASEFAVTIDRNKAAALGLSPAAIASTLRTAVYGTEATTIKKEGKEIKVYVKVDLNKDFLTPHDTTKTTIDALRELPIPTAHGMVLLGTVLNTSLDAASDVVNHEDQKRIVTVTSQLTPNANATEVSNAFVKKAKSELTLPQGVTMKVGGENEDVNQSFQDMFIALLLGLLLILIILVIEFNSYVQSVFTLSVVPLSLIGVLFGLLITVQPISFPTMLGFIALGGVVVNHAIILMDVFNRLRIEHPEMPLREVVIEGGAIRLRPILLTKITAIIGLIPLLFASSLWRPLAISMIFGLSFTGVLTLIFLPILYLKWPGKVTLPTPPTGKKHE